MYVRKEEIEKILSVMEEFPDAKTYKLKQDNTSGIGSILVLEMEMEINGRKAIVGVEIAGVETW